ncbi:MAG TPA: sulfotransferase [Candidatus Limnocylindria bacterium]|nr:sulfotransferase [Candidatus Limnocylindria bacterium]
MRRHSSDLLELAAGYVAYRLRRPLSASPIFVIGTGRSGTNWVGNVLGAHPEIGASIERPRFFRLSVAMAVDPRSRERLFKRLVRLYRYEAARVAPRHFADKSHPNIWFAELLAEEFPDALFVGVRRSVYGTVASMLKHQGVRRWLEEWRQYPLPNRFLGIGAADTDWYESLSLAGRGALRWVAHEQRFAELRPLLGSRLVEISYEELHRAPAESLRAVEEILELQTPIPEPTVNRRSLGRWREELTPDQVQEIARVIELKLAGSNDVALPAGRLA